MVQKLLKPLDETMNEHKRTQLRELAALNGTVGFFGCFQFSFKASSQLKELATWNGMSAALLHSMEWACLQARGLSTLLELSCKACPITQTLLLSPLRRVPHSSALTDPTTSIIIVTNRSITQQ